MKYSMTALVLALFAAGSIGALAQAAGQQEQQPMSPQVMGQEFSELDQDQDGNLTQSEAQQAGIESVTFEAMDEDGNEQVSEQEFQRAKEGGGSR